MTVEDPDEEVFLRVRGTCCACRCCTDMHFDVRYCFFLFSRLSNQFLFQVLNDTGVKEVGYISKRHLAKEVKEGKRRINVDHEYCEMYSKYTSSISNINRIINKFYVNSASQSYQSSKSFNAWNSIFGGKQKYLKISFSIFFNSKLE